MLFPIAYNNISLKYSEAQPSEARIILERERERELLYT